MGSAKVGKELSGLLVRTSSSLVRYDAACRALAEATKVDEVKQIRDKAEAVRAYARQAKNKQLEVDAAEIRLRAERRCGELLKVMKETGQRDPGGKGKIASRSATQLKDLGLTRDQSSKWQALAAVPEKKFQSLMEEWRERVGQESERVTANLLREGQRASRDSSLAKQAWPDGKYPVIYADPPWRYEYPSTESRAIENQYPTMSLEEICALDVKGLVPQDGAVLFLWATAPKLAECVDVIRAWGFTYRTCMVWVKDRIGMGYHARSRHELLLIGKCGELAPPKPANRPDSVIVAPRLDHSVKPEIVYELIANMYPGMPRIELFARGNREGWDCWGNQANGNRS